MYGNLAEMGWKYGRILRLCDGNEYEQKCGGNVMEIDRNGGWKYGENGLTYDGNERKCNENLWKWIKMLWKWMKM